MRVKARFNGFSWQHSRHRSGQRGSFSWPGWMTRTKPISRIALTTEGRQAKPVGLVIEQVEACNFVLVGDL